MTYNSSPIMALIEEGYRNIRTLANLLIINEIECRAYGDPMGLQLKDDTACPRWSVIYKPLISGGWALGLLEYLDCDTYEEQGFLSPVEAFELIKRKVKP